MTDKKEWFEEWFDTNYYHILYKNRDDKEAEFFLTNLLDFLQLDANSCVLDLACGKGRHALFLNSKGYQVTGVDLSSQSIKWANQFNSAGLSFHVHDMREVFSKNTFDIVLNLFSSFGYFRTITDNEKMLNAVAENLKSDGVFVLDFMNVTKVINDLVAKESKEEDNITFNITRKIMDNYIIKKIEVIDADKHFYFEERVQAFTLKQLEPLFEKAGLHITNIFGDYSLNSFSENSSSRLLLIAVKK